MPNPLSRAAALACVPLLMLSACATLSPESQVRKGLIDAGLSPRMAACMAGRMADRLSLSQLRQLKSLASLRKTDKAPMSLERLIYKVRALEDPEIFAVTSRAALHCAL